jgi:methionyl-tRNA formyltransferase
MKIGYFGTPSHARDLLERLYNSDNEISFVVTNPDKPKGRDRKPMPSEVKQFALDHAIPIFQPMSWKDQSTIESILSIPCDVHIVYAYGSIIPESIYKFPRLGSINLHGSLLPKYRGASPVQSAIINGDSTTGFSIQFLAKDVDAGDIILQKEFSISEQDTTGSILNRITEEGGDSILTLLKNFPQGFNSIQQDSAQASHCKKLLADDRCINWNRSSLEIHNQIRAFFPQPLCYSTFREKRIIIRESYLPKDEFPESDLPAGTIFIPNKKSLFVICGDKKMIAIIRIQPEGKKDMHISDFINGLKPLEREKFH